MSSSSRGSANSEDLVTPDIQSAQLEGDSADLWCSGVLLLTAIFYMLQAFPRISVWCVYVPLTRLRA